MQPNDLNKPRWTPARTESASSLIVKQVRGALFDDSLQPGAFLGSEKDLCEQFQVSRLPVREALGRLEAMGIVEIKAGLYGGARIAEGNLGKYADALAIQFKLVGVTEEEMFDAQLAVESQAVELAARNACPEDIKRLTGILDELESFLEDQEAFTKQSLSFHLALVETSRNRVLIAQMQAFLNVLYVSYLPWITPRIGKQVLKRFRTLVDEISQGNPERARESIVYHLNRVRKRALAQFKTDPVSTD